MYRSGNLINWQTISCSCSCEPPGERQTTNKYTNVNNNKQTKSSLLHMHILYQRPTHEIPYKQNSLQSSTSLPSLSQQHIGLSQVVSCHGFCEIQGGGGGGQRNKPSYYILPPVCVCVCLIYSTLYVCKALFSTGYQGFCGIIMPLVLVQGSVC